MGNFAFTCVTRQRVGLLVTLSRNLCIMKPFMDQIGRDLAVKLFLGRPTHKNGQILVSAVFNRRNRRKTVFFLEKFGVFPFICIKSDKYHVLQVI